MRNDQAVKFCREPGVVGQVCNPTLLEVEAGFKSIISYKMSLRSVQITWDCLKCSKTTREYERRSLCCTTVNFENARAKKKPRRDEIPDGWFCLHTVWKQTRQKQAPASEIRIGLWFRKAGFLSVWGHFLDRFHLVKRHQLTTAQICLRICFILQ